ncbi:MAG: propanediol utilization protein [Deltaproteobacteria bacterium HGW-Deltaproteobacteria-21]|nr:MAG: propanediol utilization protein [Deltaproteobacteria bacterium HGW-Deltaproteobacteria-21]
MDKEAFIRLVRDAGVVGEGGAGFPAHVKYDTQVEVVIANGCECEPLLFTDQHIMRSHAAEIVRALQAIQSAVGAIRSIIAIKRKYTEARESLERAIADTDLEMAFLDSFYPAGDEFILVNEITGRTIPPLGLPKEVGAVVANVGTLYAVSDAMDGKPVTRKMLTVTGEVARPSVLRVPIGTSLKECVSQCGGPSVDDPVYVIGGPMTGMFVDSAEELGRKVITKTVGALIALPRDHHLHEAATVPLDTMQRRAAAACIQCRYCTDLCPRFLIGHGFETHKVMRAFSGGVDVAMEATQALMCCECGLCELFSCPMHLSPRRINRLLKARFKEKGVQHTGPREVNVEQAALQPFRKIPTSRLAVRLGIAEYMDIHPEFTGDYIPNSVLIPLQQHIGSPAVARVKTGDRVKEGDLIGEIPEGGLGSRIHASIQGIVTGVGEAIAIQGAQGV